MTPAYYREKTVSTNTYLIDSYFFSKNSQFQQTAKNSSFIRDFKTGLHNYSDFEAADHIISFILMDL